MMLSRRRLARSSRPVLALTAATLVVAAAAAQAPLPVPGQRGQGPGPQAAQMPALPTAPTVSPSPSRVQIVTGPGPMFSSLMSLPATGDLAHYRYETTEYLVSGTANDQPYTTRVVVRRPADPARFSGIVLVESMHPSGNAWMFHFTYAYTMSAGHIGVEIVTSDPAQFVAFNGPRYTALDIKPGQASGILAQVGVLLRSNNPDNPLAGLTVRKAILAGTSASAGVLVNYLPTHMVYRREGLAPIYDAFLPTSNGANIRQVDVPMIQVPTTTEAMRGTVPTRQDGDAPGDQFRVYEFAGMAHLDTRQVEAFRPNPCKYPISMFPLSTYMSVALSHLVAWTDEGAIPPRADRMLVDRTTAGDGSLIALDGFGNPRGGIRSPYVDVPIAKFGVPNEGAVPATPNTVPWVALRGEAGIDQLCRLTGYQIALSPAELRKLYRTKAEYVSKVRQRLDDLTRQGWSLPLFRDQILADAEAVTF
jgi:hypothetical protein